MSATTRKSALPLSADPNANRSVVLPRELYGLTKVEVAYLRAIIAMIQGRHGNLWRRGFNDGDFMLMVRGDDVEWVGTAQLAEELADGVRELAEEVAS